jgi:hypothetical protein
MFVSTGVQRRPLGGFIQPCLATASDRPRTGPEWVHEIKQDGYRLTAHRVGKRVRLFTRCGYDWSGRYQRIVRAMGARKQGAQSCECRDAAIWKGRLVSVMTMSILKYQCPITSDEVVTAIETDRPMLARMRDLKVSVLCPHCPAGHSIPASAMYFGERPRLQPAQP